MQTWDSRLVNFHEFTIKEPVRNKVGLVRDLAMIFTKSLCVMKWDLYVISQWSF